MRAFNAREGFDRQDDKLPEKMFKPLKGGVSDGWKLDHLEVRAAMENYYQVCGWDVNTGNPTRARLEDLELGWVADQLGVS